MKEERVKGGRWQSSGRTVVRAAIVLVTICKAHLNYVPNRHQYEHFNDSKFLLNSKHHGKGKHEVDKDNIFAKSQLVSNVLLTYNLMAMDTTLQVHVLHHEGFTFLQNLSHQDYDT
jgi:hypothetical protein